jgi:hypothetical protein
MPHLRDFVEVGHDPRFYEASIAEKIQKAIDAGKCVEMMCSDFSDPGPDFTFVLIDKRIVPGTLQEGY